MTKQWKALRHGEISVQEIAGVGDMGGQELGILVSDCLLNNKCIDKHFEAAFHVGLFQHLCGFSTISKSLNTCIGWARKSTMSTWSFRVCWVQTFDLDTRP